MAKGSLFERQTCKQLSLWWSGGRRDDIFWRTAGSGGRATNRAKVKKKTTGSYGDICAIDPYGAPLLDVFTFELKRGYSRHSAADLLDKQEKSGLQEYEHWMLQAIQSSKQAGSAFWAIITRRDKRRSVIFYPSKLDGDCFPTCAVVPMINLVTKIKDEEIVVTGILLDDFFKNFTPHRIREISKRE